MKNKPETIFITASDGFANIKFPFSGYKNIKRAVKTCDDLLGSCVINGVDMLVHRATKTESWSVV